MLEVTHLSVAYGPTVVLRDVSFGVPEKSIVALLGGNGSGKTTILNTLSGMVRAQGGAFAFEGADCTGLRPDQIVRKGVAQVPQGREVFALFQTGVARQCQQLVAEIVRVVLQPSAQPRLPLLVFVRR